VVEEEAEVEEVAWFEVEANMSSNFLSLEVLPTGWGAGTDAGFKEVEEWGR